MNIEVVKGVAAQCINDEKAWVIDGGLGIIQEFTLFPVSNDMVDVEIERGSRQISIEEVQKMASSEHCINGEMILQLLNEIERQTKPQ